MRRPVAVVDDDASLRRSLRNFLGSAGLLVHTFSSAEELLQSDKLDEISCLVLDLGMPGMSGLDLLLHLQRRQTRIPTVVLTARDDPDIRARCLAAGVSAFLPKPFLNSDLLREVRAAQSL
jgi:FixJ family two-component response regulator